MPKAKPQYQAEVLVKALIYVPLTARTLTDAATESVEWDEAIAQIGDSNQVLDTRMEVVGVSEIDGYQKLD